MLKRLQVKLKRLVWSNGTILVFGLAVVFFPFHSFAQNTPATHSYNGADQSNNQDLIITASGDNIYCTIDRLSSTMISYHIRRLGADPKGTIFLDQAVRYFYHQKWYHGNGISSSVDKARNFVLAEKINDAIASYSQQVAMDSANATLLAEDAYALALGGIYDAAFMRLDRSWNTGANIPDVNYFTAQVFALMGYDDLADQYWKGSEKYRIPVWILPRAAILLQKYKLKPRNSEKITREQLIADFKHANELVAQHLYFQSIALFRKLINLCPNEYLPYVGYSIILEKTGAFEKSAQTIEKAISLIGNNASAIENKQLLEQRLALVRQKINSLPPDAMPGISKSKEPDAFRPQMMAYAGGMIAPALININGRIGYYLSGSSNASFDFGVTDNAAVTSVNLGLSGYFRQRVFVTGAGLLLTSGNASTVLSLKISVGISIIKRDQTSSFDIFLDGTAGLTKGSVTTIGLSIGKSIYFGRRK